MLTYSIYETAGGFGYLVESADGALSVRQDTLPEVQGNVPMSYEEAEAHAQALIEAQSASE